MSIMKVIAMAGIHCASPRHDFPNLQKSFGINSLIADFGRESIDQILSNQTPDNED
jgi:hypothetical protein